mmetsp:Transcript_60851/g.162791  ORF Transcript_60851/g.162791 Transcript_60851/m.162791 type:complete len:85 (-) Transcript_60851:460-714(-)
MVLEAVCVCAFKFCLRFQIAVVDVGVGVASCPAISAISCDAAAVSYNSNPHHTHPGQRRNFLLFNEVPESEQSIPSRATIPYFL